MGWYRADVLGSRVVFTDRRGGVSRSPFDTLNLSTAQDDSRDAVERNRARATALLEGGRSPGDWVPIRQVHGARVVRGDDVEAGGEAVAADAVVLASPGRVGGVLVADCAPLALVGRGGVAAVHAGWRGLLAGVVGAAADALRQAGVEPVRALVGPCIRPCCYEFGEADLATVEGSFGRQVRGTTNAGAPALDVPAAMRSALAGAGLERVWELGVCTACSPDYFSHRRDGRTGRHGLLCTVLL